MTWSVTTDLHIPGAQRWEIAEIKGWEVPNVNGEAEDQNLYSGLGEDTPPSVGHGPRNGCLVREPAGLGPLPQERPAGPSRPRRRGQAPVAFCGCPMATLIPATFMGRVVTPGEETTAAGTDTTGGFARAT